MKALFFSLLVLSSTFAQAKTEQQVQYCKINISQDAGMYVEMNVYNKVVCSLVKIEATDIMAYEELEGIIESQNYTLGRIVSSYCKNQKDAKDCQDKLIQDTKTSLEAIVENKKRNQGDEKLTSDKLAYRSIEEAVLSSNLKIGKVVDSYCRQ